MKVNILLFVLFVAHITKGQNACTYMGYEGFINNQNIPLHNYGGGNGWAAPWEVQNDNVDTTGFRIIHNQNLSYLNSYTFGGSLRGGNQELWAGRKLNTAEPGPFADYIAEFQRIGKPGKVLYMSMLVRKEVLSNEQLFFALHLENVAWYGDVANNIKFGYFGNDAATGNVKKWAVRYNNGSIVNSVQTVQIGQDNLVVLAIHWLANNTTRFDLYVNPDPIDTVNPPATPTLSHTVSNVFLFKSLALFMGGQKNQARFDEIRFATTYRCVVPDIDTQINIPPIAVVAANTFDGTGPLTVNFNGSSSFDPDGSIASYLWDFGDGTTSTLANPVHTFNYMGENKIKLTVFDNGGLENQVLKIVKVRNAAGHYPCNTFVQNTVEATCGQTNAQLHLDSQSGETFTLRNAANVVQTPTSLGYPVIYTNLSPGNYTLKIEKGADCLSQKNLKISTDSSTCAAYNVKFCDMKMGMGLGQLADFEKDKPFKDYFKTVREARYVYTDTSTNCCQTYLQQFMTFDSLGYLLKVPFHKSNGHDYKIRYVLSADNQMPQGNYVLLYDGVGEIIFENVLNQVHTPATKRITFTVGTAQNIFMKIDSSQLGNHIRNIRIIKTTDELSYVNQPFNDFFLNQIKQFSAIRFMDWQQTNGSPLVNWADRKKKNYYTQAAYEENGFQSSGVAYEWIIELSNTLRKDIWICIPHQASNDYVTQMATLFKNGLLHNQNIYLEYSNEVWNPLFQQYHWVQAQGPSHLDQQLKYATKAVQAYKIWHTVFGAQKNKVKRVLGAWTGNPYYAQTLMTYVDSADYDYVSPSFYFGHEAAQTAANPASASSIVLKAKQDFETTDGPQMKNHYKVAKVHGKQVINYEGGQHIIRKPGFENAAYDAQILPEMYSLYMQVIDSTRNWGSKLAMPFILSGRRTSPFGSWGHLEDVLQDTTASPAPKFRAILQQTCRVERCANNVTIDQPIFTKATTIPSSNFISINSKVKNYTSTLLTANNSIAFQPGFEVERGGVFLAKVEGCLE
jgi:PKD repeat protein